MSLLRFLLCFTCFAFASTHAQKSVYPRYADMSISDVQNGIKPNNILWLYPETHLQGEQFERIELCIDLPESISKKVAHFLATDDSTKGINPFLEWQLEVSAKFSQQDGNQTKIIDAFYYADYDRDTSSSDFRQWKWIKKKNSEKMLVRFAPPEAGFWNCEVSVQTRDTSFTYKPFKFEVIRSNNPGYMKIGESRRFFALGEETYFPAGQNLVSPRCEFCFVNAGMELPSKKNPIAAQSLESWMLEPTIMKGFIMFQEHMKSLAANGGTYFRELLIPQNQDIEWEKLGNYYGRLNRAWELDEQVFLAEELGLKIQLNLQIQYALEKKLRAIWNWSVDAKDGRHSSPEHPCANPYNVQISTTKNHDSDTFYSDKTAKKFFKQKLRYISSRWGYSTSMAVFGLSSEMQIVCKDREVCVSWMEEMGDYLKDELKVDQLLIPSFKGGTSSYEKEVAALEDYPISTFNWYAATATKFQGATKVVENYNTEFDQPFFFGEMGTNALYVCDTARIEWIRDAWMSTFTGNAGVGLNWDEPFDDELRVHLGNINTFLKGIDFDGEGRPWTSQRVISDNRKAESQLLISPDRDYAIGVISNRYYNWYLYGDTTAIKNGGLACINRVPFDPGFDGSKPAAEKGIWEREYKDSPTNYIDRVSGKTEMNDYVTFSPFESFAHNTNKHYRLRLYGFQRGTYTVDFYNALTLEYLGSRTNWGPNVKLEYPEMDINTGMIAFKVRLNKAGEFPQIAEEDRIPIDYSTATREDDAAQLTIRNNRYELIFTKANKEFTFNLLDNPTQKNFKFALFNASGELIVEEEFNRDNYTVIVEQMNKGNYTLKLLINRVCYVEKIQL